MAITYRIDPSERIVYLTTTGETSFAEWRDAMLAALSDPLHQRGFNFLSDRSQETDVPDAEFARSAAQFIKQHADEMGECRWAAVSNIPAVYGMQRMFSIISDTIGITVMAFKDYEEARQWLLSLM